MKNTGDSDDLAAFLRDFETRLERQERHTHIFPPALPVLPTFPPVVIPPPEPEPTCLSWADDFDRPDGPVGPSWIQHPAGDGVFTIDDGAVTAEIDINTTLMYWHEPPLAGNTQWAEITVERAEGNNGWFTLHTFLDDTDYTSQFGEFNFYDGTFPWVPGPGDSIEVLLYSRASGSYEIIGSSGLLPYPPEPVLLRFEADPDGVQRAYINGVLVVAAADAAPATGNLIGVEMDPSSFLSAYDSPRILSASGGCLA